MKRIAALSTLIVVLLGLNAASTASAQTINDPIAEYYARISNADKVNSRGQRLSSVAAIIRQDRANFYVFGRRDPEDQADPYFSRRANRAALESRIRNGSWTSDAANMVLYGNPLIRVSVYRDRHGEYIQILVMD